MPAVRADILSLLKKANFNIIYIYNSKYKSNGASSKLNTTFEIQPIDRPRVANGSNSHPNWLAGFVEAESSFVVWLKKLHIID